MIHKLRFSVGLDLGQAADPTALAIVERCRPGTFAETLADYSKGKTLRPIYRVVHLKRFATGTGYPAIVDEVARLMADPQLAPDPQLVVDGTGVGRPVVDLLMERPILLTAVSIHGGAKQTQDGAYLGLPKRELISRTQVLLEQRRLKIAAGLPDAAVLKKELENYRVRIDPITAHDSYNAREGAHDDIVLAVTLGVWGASTWNADEWEIEDGMDPNDNGQLATVALLRKQEMLQEFKDQSIRRERIGEEFDPGEAFDDRELWG